MCRTNLPVTLLFVIDPGDAGFANALGGAHQLAASTQPLDPLKFRTFRMEEAAKVGAKIGA